MLSISRKWFKTYFKSRTHVPSNMHITKKHVLKSREDLCHALTVEKSFLHQTLSTVVFNCGETLSFQATGYKTIDQIQLFYFPKRGLIWQHTHLHITWKMAVLKKKIVLGGINMFGNSCSNIGLKNIQLVIRHLASKKDVNVDSFSYLCQLPLHTFMRIKVLKMKMKYCGIH